MPTFHDKKNQPWLINLDPFLIQEVKEKHGINLVDLSENDPLTTLRTDPLKLVAVIAILCDEEIQKKGLTPEQFGRSLKFPPDEMLDAVRDAIIDFFPSGQASHVREVLARYEEMAKKTNELMIAKMDRVMNDPKTTEMITAKTDLEYDKLIGTIYPTTEPGV